jgi:hypothetical protein
MCALRRPLRLRVKVPPAKGVANYAVANICVTSTGDGAHDAYGANLIGRKAKA